jgi:hypothetical protein
MRTTEWKYNVTIAENEDIQKAFDLINRNMPVKMNETYFSWLSKSSIPEIPQVFIVKEDEKISAAVIGYPEKIKIDRMPVFSPFIGQLCTDSKKSVGKRGVGLELLLKTERYYLENQNSWLLHGLIGEDLYQRFHRKMLGIGKSDLNTICLYMLDLEEYLVKFCDIVSKLEISKYVNITIKMTTLLKDVFYLKIDKYGCSYSKNLPTKTVHLHLKGNLWPLFRVVVDNEGKGRLFKLILSRQMIVYGFISHFQKTLQIFKIFKQVYERKNE